MAFVSDKGLMWSFEIIAKGRGECASNHHSRQALELWEVRPATRLLCGPHQPASFIRVQMPPMTGQDESRNVALLPIIGSLIFTRGWVVALEVSFLIYLPKPSHQATSSFFLIFCMPTDTTESNPPTPALFLESRHQQKPHNDFIVVSKEPNLSSPILSFQVY